MPMVPASSRYCSPQSKPNPLRRHRSFHASSLYYGSFTGRVGDCFSCFRTRYLEPRARHVDISYPEFIHTPYGFIEYDGIMVEDPAKFLVNLVLFGRLKFCFDLAPAAYYVDMPRGMIYSRSNVDAIRPEVLIE